MDWPSIYDRESPALLSHLLDLGSGSNGLNRHLRELETMEREIR